MIDPMQLMRISEHPIGINDNLIVYDDLEHRALRIYEHISPGPVTVQQLASETMSIKNAVPIAQIIVSSLWKDEGVFIHKITCEYGHENLVEPMIKQVFHYANFYSQFEVIGITDREYDTWFPYAKESLKDFQRVNRVYEYWLDGHREE